MKKTYQSNLILIFLISILTLYLVNSTLIINGILDYTNLFITKLFPTSFVIFTFSSLLINYQLIEKLSKITKSNNASSYIIIMSMISGFPSGPKYTKELYEKNYLTKKTSNALLAYTHFPNPIFILGPVKELINNHVITLRLLLALYLSNIIIGIIVHRNNNSSELPKTTQQSFETSLNKAITSSLKTLILVYGTSLFFYLISLIITHYIDTSPLAYTIINGTFDLTKGIFSTSLITPPILKTLLILIFISFGSISIHIQIKSILSDTSLSYKNFLYGRTIGTILSITIFLILNWF